jgi:carbonic anhydrase/acetyltransferase-like protein (isoleucine patch superfamily)
MPLFTHRGHSPQVHPDAYVAPTAVLCGDVHIDADARILFGAVITAEDGQVRIGRRCVVMENALVRGRADHPATICDDVLIGPHAHINGATVGGGCFLATGCSLFPGAQLAHNVEVRINAIVHVNTTLAAGTTVPIAWIAVGDPAQILPPERHEEIWAILKDLDFPQTVYGVDRATPVAELMTRQVHWYGHHRDDRLI